MNIIIGTLKKYFSKSHHSSDEEEESSDGNHSYHSQENLVAEQNIGIQENAEEIINIQEDQNDINQENNLELNYDQLIQNLFNDEPVVEENAGEHIPEAMNIVIEENNNEIQEPLNVSPERSASSLSNNSIEEEEKENNREEESENSEIESPLSPGTKGSHLRREGLRRPRPAFFHYQAELRRTHRSASSRDIVSFARDEYSSMSDIEKNRYRNMAEVDMERYRLDCNKYDRRNSDRIENHNEILKMRRKERNKKYYEGKKKRKFHTLDFADERPPLKKHKPDDDEDNDDFMGAAEQNIV